jgi:hypothetical protein
MDARTVGRGRIVALLLDTLAGSGRRSLMPGHVRSGQCRVSQGIERVGHASHVLQLDPNCQALLKENEGFLYLTLLQERLATA